MVSIAVLAHGEGGVDAAVVELDALADAVGPAAQDHDLLAVRGLGLALLLVGGVHVGGAGGELRRTGVDALVHRAHAHGCGAARGPPVRVRPASAARRWSENPLRLSWRKRSARQPGASFGPDLSLQLDELLDLGQEPGVDAGDALDLLRRHAGAEGIGQVEDALGTGLADLLAQQARGPRGRTGPTSSSSPSCPSPARAGPSAGTPGRCARWP